MMSNLFERDSAKPAFISISLVSYIVYLIYTCCQVIIRLLSSAYYMIDTIRRLNCRQENRRKNFSGALQMFGAVLVAVSCYLFIRKLPDYTFQTGIALLLRFPKA